MSIIIVKITGMRENEIYYTMPQNDDSNEYKKVIQKGNLNCLIDRGMRMGDVYLVNVMKDDDWNLSSMADISDEFHNVQPESPTDDLISLMMESQTE